MKNRLNKTDDSEELKLTFPSSDSLAEDIAERDRGEIFLTLLAQHQHRIGAFVHAIVPNWQDAEEIIQDTLLVLWRKFDEFDPKTNFFSWAARVAQFEVLNYRRRASHRCHALEESAIEAIAMASNQSLDDIEHYRESLEICLGRLSKDDRELVRMRYEENANVRSIAETLNRDRSHVHRLIRAMRRRLLRCIRSRT